jgi:hypothetical protein
MSLAIKLIRKVQEAKAAQDEMGVPKYDNLHTPNNHVGSTASATNKTKKVSGLGDRKLKKPTAFVGHPGKERRDMEGVKGIKVTEGVAEDLGLTATDGLFSFHRPGDPSNAYSIELTPEVLQFVHRAVKSSDTQTVFELLMDYYEQGPGQDPRNQTTQRGDGQVGLAASVGDWPLSEDPASTNPIVQALSLRVEGNMFYMTAPDGSAGFTIPASKGLAKAISNFISNPDARADTQAAAARLFQLVGKQPGAKAAEPDKLTATRNQSSAMSKGVAPNAGSGLSLEPQAAPAEKPPGAAVNPYARGQRRVGESVHKAADGEMSHPKVANGKGVAKTAKVRGKQNDAPTNKGNPGNGKEEKGQTKKQFQVSPQQIKGGSNVHKSMKKMHEGKLDLEKLLGRKLQLTGVASV